VFRRRAKSYLRFCTTDDRFDRTATSGKFGAARNNLVPKQFQ